MYPKEKFMTNEHVEDVATKEFDPHYMRMVIKLLTYAGPDDNYPRGIPGGKNAIDSPQFNESELGNDIISDGTWFQTTTHDGKYMAFFVPDLDLIKGDSILRTHSIIQKIDGERLKITPGEALNILQCGYTDKE